jgi:hypothetical protein
MAAARALMAAARALMAAARALISVHTVTHHTASYRCAPNHCLSGHPPLQVAMETPAGVFHGPIPTSCFLSLPDDLGEGATHRQMVEDPGAFAFFRKFDLWRG